MEPGGQTQPYAVLGHPIAHTLSPCLHNAAFAALGWDALYLAFDVPPASLMDVLASMRRMGFRGVNLTVPHKEVAFRGLTDLDASSRLVGAVNTVEITPEGMRGHSTDGYGFLRAVREAFGSGPEGQEVVVLGSGGSARSLALVCACEGAASVTLVARNREKSEALVAELREQSPGVPAAVVCDPERQRDAVRAGELVIQATPVGLHAGDPPLFPSDAFRSGQRVYDLVYSFPVTPTLSAAREAGAHIANGLDMLLYQGVRSFEIWTHTPPPVNVMREALRKAVQ